MEVLDTHFLRAPEVLDGSLGEEVLDTHFLRVSTPVRERGCVNVDAGCANVDALTWMR